MNNFERTISKYFLDGLHAGKIETLQVNTGLLCDQSCSHCHLECGPDRTEVMGWPVIQHIVEAADACQPRAVDIIGGAPELNPYIRDFIGELRSRSIQVQLRTNLTAMVEPGLEDLPFFLREHGVKLVVSLPCYLEENVCCQRDTVAFEKSIRALKLLNEAGYTATPELQLQQVYNPGGTSLPGRQSATLEAYQRELYRQYNISFSRLFSITDKPSGRYLASIRHEGRDVEYSQLLRRAFNPCTLDLLMCRNQLSIGWDGRLYDCDFNMSRGVGVYSDATSVLEDVDYDLLAGRKIVTGDHCFSCTASYGPSGCDY